MHDKCIICKENMLQTDRTLVPSNLLFIFMHMVARTGLYWATTENLVFRPWHWRWLARKCRLKFWAKNSYYQSTSERNCNSESSDRRSQIWSEVIGKNRKKLLLPKWLQRSMEIRIILKWLVVACAKILLSSIMKWRSISQKLRVSRKK